jgi:hypothetical protein
MSSIQGGLAFWENGLKARMWLAACSFVLRRTMSEISILNASINWYRKTGQCVQIEFMASNCTRFVSGTCFCQEREKEIEYELGKPTKKNIRISASTFKPLKVCQYQSMRKKYESTDLKKKKSFAWPSQWLSSPLGPHCVRRPNMLANFGTKSTKRPRPRKFIITLKLMPTSVIV